MTPFPDSLLKPFLSLPCGAAWSGAESLMQALQGAGFDAAFKENYHASTTGGNDLAAQFSQTLTLAGEEKAMAVFARDSSGDVAACTISWAAGKESDPSRVEALVQATLTHLSAVFGAPGALLNQAGEWQRENTPTDIIVAGAFWTRPSHIPQSPQAGAVPRAYTDHGRYSAELEKARMPMTANLSITLDGRGLWLVIVTLIA